MNSSKKKDQNSMFHRALGRMSFRSRKDKQNSDKKSIKKQNIHENIAKYQNISYTNVEVTEKENYEEKENINMKEDKIYEPAIHSSSTYIQSRPITHLEAALKDFQMSTAKSRESLSLPISDKSSLLLRRTEPRQGREVNTTTKCWRQKPPPVNNYLENTWRTLSNSMMDIHRRGEDNTDDKENDCKTISQDKEDKDDTVKNVVVETHKISKAKSMNVLDSFEKTLEVIYLLVLIISSPIS